MRATDDRYRSEQGRFELAMRMIRHEARTGTIRFWTGLSDDRIRKLYTSYFKYSAMAVKRRRGKSPTQIMPLVKSPARTLETGVFANLLIANGLLIDTASRPPSLRRNIDLGHRFCECFETYRSLVPRAALTFEWGWNLLLSIRRGDELGIAQCEQCSSCYVRDLLSVPYAHCPVCAVFDPVGRTGLMN
jgi:hypothetical protein